MNECIAAQGVQRPERSVSRFRSVLPFAERNRTACNTRNGGTQSIPSSGSLISYPELPAVSLDFMEWNE